MTLYDVAAVLVAIFLIVLSVGWVVLTTATSHAFLSREPVDLDARDFEHRPYDQP